MQLRRRFDDSKCHARTKCSEWLSETTITSSVASIANISVEVRTIGIGGYHLEGKHKQSKENNTV